MLQTQQHSTVFVLDGSGAAISYCVCLSLTDAHVHLSGNLYSV